MTLKAIIHDAEEGLDFCGFVVRADGRVRLRSSGVIMIYQIGQTRPSAATLAKYGVPGL